MSDPEKVIANVADDAANKAAAATGAAVTGEVNKVAAEAAATETTAEAAVALAQANAAAANMDAAERIRRFEEGSVEWRTRQTQEVEQLKGAVTGLAGSLTELSSGMAKLLSSIPEKPSETTPPAVAPPKEAPANADDQREEKTKPKRKRRWL